MKHDFRSVAKNPDWWSAAFAAVLVFLELSKHF